MFYDLSCENESKILTRNQNRVNYICEYILINNRRMAHILIRRARQTLFIKFSMLKKDKPARKTSYPLAGVDYRPNLTIKIFIYS